MKKYRNYFILIGLFIVLLIINVVWIKLDLRPPAWDQSTHFLLGYEYLHAFREFNIWKILTVSNFYPPLYHISLVPFIATAPSVDSAVMVNFVYLAIALGSLYALGSLIFNENVGLLAAVLLGLFPFIQVMTRECMIDLALTAWVCLSMLLLIRSRYFMSSKYSFFFTCAAAAGMLTKWNFIFYISIPLLVCMYRARPDHKRKAWLSILGIAILSSPWYLVNAAQIIRKGMRYVAIGGVEGDPRIFTMSSLLWYPLSLGEQIFIPAMLIFLWAFILLIMKPQKGKWLLLLWTCVPAGIHTLMSNKDIRYTLPVLPAVALIIAVWLLRDGQKPYAKKLWITSFLVILSLETIHASFAVPGCIPRTSFFVLHKNQVMFNPQPYQSDTWKHKEICDQLTAEISEDEQRPVNVTVVANHPYVHGASLRTYARIHQLPLVFNGYTKRLGEFTDFIIFKTGNRGPAFTLGKINQAAEAIGDPRSQVNRNFKLFSSIPLPDGSYAALYKRSVTPYAGPLATQMELHFNSIKYKKFEAAQVNLYIESDSLESAQKGDFKRLHLSSNSLQYKGLLLHDLAVNFDHITIDLPVLLEQKEVFFLNVDNIELSVRLKEESLISYIQQKCRCLKNLTIRMNEDKIVCRARGYGIPISFVLRSGIDARREYLWTELSKLKIMHIPIPSIVYAALINREFSLMPGHELPFRLGLKQIVITEGSVIIQ
ncbi:MAG: glycosyltransferase family 39 protein [bacterium]